jgi:phosphoglycolate phosphatase-like HAD superfamily hydrolase
MAFSSTRARRSRPASITAVPGISAVLCELGHSFRLAIASSKPRMFAEPLLDALGLLGFFELCAGPDLSLAGGSTSAVPASALFR